MREAATEIPTTIGPAARASLVRELGEPDLRQALATVIGDATREVIVTTRGTVGEVRMQNEAAGTGLIVAGRRVLALSWLLAFGLGVVTIGLVVAVVRMRSQTQRYKRALMEALPARRADAVT